MTKPNEVLEEVDVQTRKKSVTPVKKVSKENIKPRVISQTDVKKGPVRQSLAPKSKLGLRQPATEVKKPNIPVKKKLTEVERPLSSNCSPANSWLSRKSVATGGPVAKTLQFSPRKREGPGQFKEPIKAREPAVKTYRSLLAPPRPGGTLRPPTNLAVRPRPQSTSSGLPRSGLVRPTLFRSG